MVVFTVDCKNNKLYSYSLNDIDELLAYFYSYNNELMMKIFF